MEPVYRQIRFNSGEYRQSVKLREVVLRKPLGLSFSAKDLEPDAHEIHLAAFHKGVLLAILLLKPLGAGEVKMRQVAVDASLQGQGIGRGLVLFAEQFAVARGFTHMVLNARMVSSPFYTKLNYQTEGVVFQEVGIDHIKMQKALPAH